MQLSKRDQQRLSSLCEAIKEAERFLLRAKLAASALRVGKE